jgi:outer membrane protein OmpA-like peptidoglycan-associated protein
MKSSMFTRFSALAAVVALVAACSGLQKNQALIDAEDFYATTKQNENVLRYAPNELQRAEEALNLAAVAESEQDMTSLAYVGLTRTQTALAIAERKVARAKLAELSQTKDEARLAARDLQIESAQADANALRLQLEALQAVSTDRGMVMTLGDVLFATGKADLQPGAMNTVDRLAVFLSEYPDKTVLIEGFTDNTGTDAFNQGLSERRAASGESALIQAGVSPGSISTIGYGKARPIADNGTAEGRLRNRRVEIVING